MGFFKSIFKSIGNALKKVFKPILKPFKKLLSSKFFKVAMLAVSVFTAGASLITAFGQGGMKAVGNLVLKKSAELLTMPIDMVAKGIEAVGNVTGIAPLKDFAVGVQNGLGKVVDAAGSVFQVDAPNTSIADVAKEDAGIGSENISAETGDSAATKTLDADVSPSASNQLQQDPATADGPAGGTPQQGAAPSADPGATTQPGGGAPTPLDVSPAAGPGQGTPTLPGSKTGGGNFFVQAMEHIQKNDKAWKMGLDMVAGMTEEDPASVKARAESEFYHRRDQDFASSAEQGYMDKPPGNYAPLRQRNAGLVRRAQESRNSMTHGNTRAVHGGT